MQADDVKRRKELERENPQHLVADKELENLALPEISKGKLVSPSRRRQAVLMLQDRLWHLGAAGVPIRGQHRSTQRHADHVWALDFQFERTADGRILKLLQVVDEFTREALTIECHRGHDPRIGRFIAPPPAPGSARTPPAHRRDTIGFVTLIEVGEIELDCERSGNAGGPPLLLIMGMSGTALHWSEPFLELLRADFDVIAYDHHGVGASTPLNGPITTREMADDAAGLLAALGLGDAHVLGISMGGMVAQELVLNHPERVRTLTLGCTYCGGEGSALASPQDLSELVEAMGSGNRERAIRAGWEINVSAEAAADEHAYASFREIAERRAVAVPVIMQQMQACAAHDTNARLDRIATPTLVIHGTEDRLLPVQNGRLIASRIPGAQLEIFDGVGHLFFWERPERSAELVRAHAAVPA
jgi:pimeloyl-ACP methyl ester carboxylesterase